MCAYGGEISPALLVLTIQVHGSGPGQDRLVLGREMLEDPSRRRVLRADLPGLQRRPDPGKGEQNVAGIGLKIAEQLRYASDRTADEVVVWHRVQQLRGRGPAQRSPAAPL